MKPSQDFKTMWLAALGAAILALLIAHAAHAQTTYIRPYGTLGGYVATTPGEMPTYIRPYGLGGYVIQQPQVPTYSFPQPSAPMYLPQQGNLAPGLNLQPPTMGNPYWAR